MDSFRDLRDSVYSVWGKGKRFADHGGQLDISDGLYCVHDPARKRTQETEQRVEGNMMKNPLEVLQIMDDIRAKTLIYFESFSQEQLDWRPPQGKEEGAWSLGEVFMHLAIDEIYLREMIAKPLLEGVKPPDGITFLPPPPPYGTAKNVIQYWFNRARLGTKIYFDNWPNKANMALVHEGGLREMNGLEWFEGYAGHEAFHHQQIEALIAQLG